ncbi:MAG: fructose 1,6-bisphosphatase [Syntrophobacterales bacterium]|jgi:fructose 1,6-bisphosphate aldolase/phosphatase
MTPEAGTKEPERQAGRVVVTVVSAQVLPWLGGRAAIPDELVEAAASLLKEKKEQGAILDFRVYPFAKDLHVQINTFGAQLHDPLPHRLAFQAALASLKRAAAIGCYRTRHTDIFQLTPQEQIAALCLRPVTFPFTERKSEPIMIAKLISATAGGFNRMLFNLFFHPDKGSHRRLDGTRFLALVESAEDLASGKKERRLFAFGDRLLEESLFLLYPFAQEPLQFSRDQVGDTGELLSLIANPVEWILSAVYAVQGRLAFAKDKPQDTRHEPVAVVSIQGALPDFEVDSPVALLRLQSGSPAVGEAHLNLGADFLYVEGGPGGGYHVGVMPVTMSQARVESDSPGAAKLVAYTYQSYGNGRIPPEHDVIDVFGQDLVQTEWLQDEAREFIHLIVEHGEFQPRLTAKEAETRGRRCADRLSRLFEQVPSSGEDQVDALIVKANQRSQGETLSDIKADAGGKVGHTTTPTLFGSVARASLAEAREQGLIKSFHIFPVGDDLHLVMSHGHGIDANEIHLLAFRTFWRLVWVTELIGYKPYGLAQDLAIGPATKGKKVDDLAEPSQQFVARLAEELPEPERTFLEKIRHAQKEWTQGRGAVEVSKPFAGNVTGQGPGFAELPAKNISGLGLLAGDKCGPAAFNIPVYLTVGQVILQEQFRQRFGESIAYEIFDVHNNKRIFLDARSHQEDILTLLGSTNLFNIKRLWSLPQVVAHPEAVKDNLGDIILSASTERLALIAGGEYVGKDDPVLLGVEDLMQVMFELPKTKFFMTQGDERGSHYMMLVPKPVKEAVATVRSRGFQVGLSITLNTEGIAEVHDVYEQPEFRAARIRIDKANARIWRAQGSEFTPVGVGARDVEPAYPLMRVLHRITGEGSPYILRIQGLVEGLYREVARGGV